MKRGSALGWPLLVIALYAGVATGALGFLPLALRLLAALAGIVFLPGVALLSWTSFAPGGPLLSAGWAAGMGIAWNGVLLLGLRLAGLDFRLLLWLSPLASGLLWIASSVRPVPPREEPQAVVWSGAARAAVMAAVVLAALHGLRMGTPVGYYTDSPDHIATVRRMMGTGDMFPRDAYFADAGRQGVDPRKGFWHPQVALLCLAARADAMEGWRGLATWLCPLLLLNAGALGFLAGGAGVAALAAWIQFLTLGGSLADHYFREAVFSTRLGDCLALAAGTALALDLTWPSSRRRAAAVLLALGSVVTHVYYAWQLALVSAGLGLLLAARRVDRPRLPRWLGTSLAMGLASLPVLLFRAGSDFAPKNIIHTAPQGLLYLNDHLRVVSVGVMWDWLGLLWLALPFLLAWAFSRSAGNPALLYLVAAGVGPLLVMFLPPFVEVLRPRLGYLLMRMVWMIPQAVLLALAVAALARALRSRARKPWPAAAGLAVLTLLGAHSVVDAARVLVRPAPFRAEEEAHSPLLWRDALAWMDRHLPAGTVVLADPVTSYSVPMMTRHYVVTLVDQHSSPNDPRALSRILDARDALDPYGTWRRTLEVLRAYHVGAIALNDRFVRPVGLDYWAPYPGLADRLRARLGLHPEIFPVLYDSAGFTLYGVHSPLPDSLPETGAAPPWLVASLPPGARAVSDSSAQPLRLAGIELDSGAPELDRGDTLRARAYWVTRSPLPAASYSVAVRFDREGLGPPSILFWAAKPWRKLIESLRQERYRFRQDHLPGEGQFNVDRWPPGRMVRDPFEVIVPLDVAPGDYRVGVRMIAPEGHYPNFRLSDYFSDQDYYAGVEVGRIRVREGRAR